MKAAEQPCVAAGWVTFGGELALRSELIQSVEVAPAAAVNVPEGEAPASGWYQVEVKCAPRSAPYVVFVGSERCARAKVSRLLESLRHEAMVVHEMELRRLERGVAGVGR